MMMMIDDDDDDDDDDNIRQTFKNKQFQHVLSNEKDRTIKVNRSLFMIFSYETNDKLSKAYKS